MKTLGEKILTYSRAARNIVIVVVLLPIAGILFLSYCTDVTDQVKVVRDLTPSIVKIIGVQ